MPFISPSTLAVIRDRYASTCDTPCSIWRDGVDAEGLSTGILEFVENTTMSLNPSGSGATSPFIDTILRAVTVKVPGQRTLSFAWDQEVWSGDIIMDQPVEDELAPEIPEDANQYRASYVDHDDQNRFGIRVTCELIRTQS